MKKLKSEFDPKKNSSPVFRSSNAVSGLLGAAALTLVLPLAGTSVHADEPAPAPPPAPSKLNFLVNFEFSDKYLTPRGMIVQNQGVVFQPLVLGFADLYKADSFVNDVTLVGGFWNCFGTSGLASSDSNGAKTTSWYEIDPIVGLSFSFAKNFKLDVTYTAFNMEVFNIPFSQHLETKLSFNDSQYLKEFALHPYVSYWQELSGKAVASYHSGSSYYFDLGIAPSYTFKSCGLTVEAPLRVLLPNANFYGDITDGGPAEASTVGLYELGVKAGMPLKFMPEGYGHWSAHLGYRFQNFVDKNLQTLNPGNPKEAHQVYFGISSFF